MTGLSWASHHNLVELGKLHVEAAEGRLTMDQLKLIGCSALFAGRRIDVLTDEMIERRAQQALHACLYAHTDAMPAVVQILGIRLMESS